MSVVVGSRIIFEYHNWNQIIVGLVFGSMLASAYYVFISLLREYGVLDRVLQLEIFRWWGMKDGFGRGMFKTLAEERAEWEKETYAYTETSIGKP